MTSKNTEDSHNESKQLVKGNNITCTYLQPQNRCHSTLYPRDMIYFRYTIVNTSMKTIIIIIIIIINSITPGIIIICPVIINNYLFIM